MVTGRLEVGYYLLYDESPVVPDSVTHPVSVIPDPCAGKGFRKEQGEDSDGTPPVRDTVGSSKDGGGRLVNPHLFRSPTMCLYRDDRG